MVWREQLVQLQKITAPFENRIENFSCSWVERMKKAKSLCLASVVLCIDNLNCYF